MFAKLLLVAGLLAWGAAASGAPRQIVPPLYPGKVVSFFLDETSLSKKPTVRRRAQRGTPWKSRPTATACGPCRGQGFWVPKREVKFSSSVDVESICLTAKVQVATAVTRNANEGCVKK